MAAEWINSISVHKKMEKAAKQSVQYVQGDDSRVSDYITHWFSEFIPLIDPQIKWLGHFYIQKLDIQNH